ncbi:MAG TPA: histidine phosphatase family protein [Devosia sp.]|nr:histidine phosphatase family protein [Devosia sp.]
MRILDIRRHTMRRKPEVHLSQQGIALAQLVGDASGPYSMVVTSTVPRAIETAIAMGFAVDETLDALGYLPDTVFAEIGWPLPFTQIAQALVRTKIGTQFAEAQARLWRKIAERIPHDQQALIITHGLFVELGLLASLPAIEPANWGGPVGYCEGVRLVYEDGCQHGEMLRLPAALQLIDNS